MTLLGHHGHRVVEAADGVEGLKQALAEKPDLIITDILMPKMDGYEFVRQLRVNPTLASIPIIFYTAHYRESEAQTLARTCGVPYILPKPSKPQAVLKIVETALSSALPPVPPPPPEAFDREHLRLLTNKLSEKVDELRKVNARLSTLIDINLQLASELNPGRLLEKFCQAARELVGAKVATVSVLREDEQALRYFFSNGLEVRKQPGLDSSLPHSDILTSLLVERRSYRQQNPGGSPEVIGFPSGYPPIHTLLVAPILSPSRVYGWLCLIDKIDTEAFSEEDERLATILAAQMGRVYVNGQLYLEVQRHTEELEHEIVRRQQAEEALRASEERFRALIENSSEAIALLSAEGIILYGSPSTNRVLGYELDEFVGRNIFQLIHPSHQEFVRKRLSEVRQKPRMTVTVHTEILHQDGSWRFLKCMLTNLLDDPRIQAIVNNYRDTTTTPYELLTSRQWEVLHLIVEGYTNVEIAARLVISRRTVEMHRADLMRKLGVRTQAELIRYALEQGILPSEEEFRS